MENVKSKKNSLYFELAFLLLVAGSVALLFFFVLNHAGTRLITGCFSSREYIEKLREDNVADLRKHIAANQVGTDDSGKLSK